MRCQRAQPAPKSAARNARLQSLCGGSPRGLAVHRRRCSSAHRGNKNLRTNLKWAPGLPRDGLAVTFSAGLRREDDRLTNTSRALPGLFGGLISPREGNYNQRLALIRPVIMRALASAGATTDEPGIAPGMCKTWTSPGHFPDLTKRSFEASRTRSDSNNPLKTRH